jgi:cytochrome c peroxidase
MSRVRPTALVPRRSALAISVGALLAASCARDDLGLAPTPDAGADAYEWNLPRGFPEPVVPDDNPMSEEKVELGRHLFYDERLSGNGTQACATCHRQEHAFAGGVATNVGSTGDPVPRRSQPLVNAAYSYPLTWASLELRSLEDQIRVPMFGEDPVELGITGHEQVVLDRLRDDARYQDLFAGAFPDDEDPIHFDNAVKALASFVRSIVSSGNAPFHRFVYYGEQSALSDSEKSGLDLLFTERLECHHCHSGFAMTNAVRHQNSTFIEFLVFHNIGLYNIDGEGGYPEPNTGLYAETGNPLDMGRFRAPTLLNVEVSGPYMHDGSVASLEEVLDIYASAGHVIDDGPHAGDGRANPNKRRFVPGFQLSDQEREDVLNFLKSLTDHDVLNDPRYADPFAQD